MTENLCQLIEEDDHDCYIFPVVDERDYKWFVEAAKEGRDAVYRLMHNWLYDGNLRSFDPKLVRSLEVKDIEGREVAEGNGETAKLVILKVNLRGCKCQTVTEADLYSSLSSNSSESG